MSANTELLRQVCLAEVVAMDFMLNGNKLTWVSLITVHAFLNCVIDLANADPVVSVVKAGEIAFLKRARCDASSMLMPPDAV